MKKNFKLNLFIAFAFFVFCFFFGFLIYQNVNGISHSLSDQEFLQIVKKVNSDSSFTPTERDALFPENSKKIEMSIFTPPNSRGDYLVFNWNGKKYSYFVAGGNGSLNSTSEQRVINNFQNFDANNGSSFAGTSIANFFKRSNITRISNYPSAMFSEKIISGMISLFFALLIVFSLWMVYNHLKKSGMLSQSFLEIKAKKTNITFKDVAGILEEKKELLEIVDFLKQPKKYTSVGARIPKGILLYGPPGTGKTLLAKAVSGEAGVSFISANGSSFDEVYAGLGASRIRGLFGAARKVAPCIIFIDEIDSLGSIRGGPGGVSAGSDQTLNQFLSELDGFETQEGIILIGATNRMNILDPALLRSGRLDRKIQLPLPDVKEREAILNVHAQKKNISKEVSLKEVAERTPGFSGAELENSLNEAALVAVRRNKKKIDPEDIEEGIDRVVGGPAKKSKIINDKTRLIVAIHEAGHSVVGLVLEGAMQIQKVTIIPRGEAGGYTVSTPKEEGLINTKEMLLEKITGFLGGRAAEEFVFGKDNITTGAYDDFMKASQIARSMVEKFGMSKAGVRFLDSERRTWFRNENDVSEKKKETQDSEIDKILDLGFKKANDIIKKNIDIVFLIAESLLVLETITSTDLKYILKNKKLPAVVIAKKEKNKDKKYFDLSIIKKSDSSN